MKTIYHLVDIAAPRGTVAAALTSIEGLASWWTTQVSGDAGADGEITFTFGAEFNPVMHVVRADSDSVSWLCTGGVAQWADNTFWFDLADRDQGTRLRFRQEYAIELSDDDYATYNYNWGYYLESLRLLCTNGSGKPYHPGAEPPVAELISVARATAKPGRADDLERELRARVAPTLAQPGNIEFALYRSLDAPTAFLAFEHWRSHADWRHHLSGEHVTSLLAVFADVLDSPPDIQISTPIAADGDTGPAPTSDVTRNAARRLAADVFSRGDLAVYDELVAEDYVNHNIPVPGIPGTKDGFRSLVIATRSAFSDLAVEMQDIVTEGDFVVFHDHVTATSTGEFFGVPPSGATADWTEIHFLRVRDGQIVEHWTNFDQLGILRQLGAIPA